MLDESKIITWSDYRREDGDATFGLLCQVSPDGRYVVGHRQGPGVGRLPARPDVLPALLPGQGNPGDLRPADEDVSRPCPAPTIRSSCRPTRPGARTASTIVFARSARPTSRKGVRERQVGAGPRRKPPRSSWKGARRSSTTCTASRSTAAQGGKAEPIAGRLEQRPEQLLRQVLARRQVDRLLPGQELHAAAARQRAVHHSGRRGRGPPAASATRRG